MLLALVLLAQTATARTTPTPVPSPTVAAPAKLGGGFGTKAPPAGQKARVVLTDDTLAPTRTGRGAFSVAGAPIASRALPANLGAPSPEAIAAQERMDRAVQSGTWVAGNITYNESIRQGARSEWDAAEANCRRTPGCTPQTIPSGLIPTGDETLRKLHKNPFKR